MMLGKETYICHSGQRKEDINVIIDIAEGNSNQHKASKSDREKHN